MGFKMKILVPLVALHKSDDKSGTRIYFGFIFFRILLGWGDFTCVNCVKTGFVF